jgi:hypothetical protein
MGFSSRPPARARPLRDRRRRLFLCPSLTQGCGAKAETPQSCLWADTRFPTAMSAHRGARLQLTRHGLCPPNRGRYRAARAWPCPSAGFTGRNRKPASPDRPGICANSRQPYPGDSCRVGPRLIRLQPSVQASLPLPKAFTGIGGCKTTCRDPVT